MSSTGPRSAISSPRRSARTSQAPSRDPEWQRQAWLADLSALSRRDCSCIICALDVLDSIDPTDRDRSPNLSSDLPRIWTHPTARSYIPSVFQNEAEAEAVGGSEVDRQAMGARLLGLPDWDAAVGSAWETLQVLARHGREPSKSR